MYNFVHVYSDKKRSINVSIPYYIYGKSNRKNNLFVQLNKIMRIGTPQKEVKKPLFAENGGYPPTQNGDIRSLFWLFSLMALQN